MKYALSFVLGFSSALVLMLVSERLMARHERAASGVFKSDVSICDLRACTEGESLGGFIKGTAFSVTYDLTLSTETKVDRGKLNRFLESNK